MASTQTTGATARRGNASATELTPPEREAIHAATHSAYRPDIDGLRALAVLSVIFNHVKAPGFFGGFVGVDIFFVISGYLITGILVRDLAVGRHSIAEFYRRRILRIFPALFAMLAITTAISCVTMMPGEVMRYARSLGATTLFGSNFVFWSETGYFDEASHIKPLLHTWSLAIEEQFYILWPLMLAAISAVRPARIKAAVLAVTALSFAASVAMVTSMPSAAFFLLPARAWELGVGAVLAVTPFAFRNRWINEGLAVVGLGMILYAIKFYNDGTPFPGTAALLPCIGAGLLILTGSTGTWVARAMSLPPILLIGQTSYSLYLWHWPVIVFATIGLFLPPTPIVMAGQVALSLLLGWLSWRFVERPFRVGASRWRTPRVLIGGVAAIAASLLIAAALVASGGLASRFTPEQRALAGWRMSDSNRDFRGGTCFRFRESQVFDAAQCLARNDPAKPSVLILGDSHAAHLWPGFAAQRGRLDVLQATRAGCMPLLNPGPGACNRFFREMLTTWLPANHPDATLISARWTQGDLPLLAKTLADPRVRAGHPILIGPIPRYATSLPRLLLFAEVRHDPTLARDALVPDAFETDRAMRRIAADTGTPYISLVDLLCRPNVGCRTWARPGVPLQFDYGHLTAPGSEVTAAAMMPQIEAAIRSRTGAR